MRLPVLTRVKLHRNTVDAVIRSLHAIFNEGKYAEHVIDRVLKENPKWGSNDRRFIARTTYDIVRWYRLFKEVSGAAEFDFEKIFSAYCVIKGISSSDPSDSLKEKLLHVQMVRKIRESIPDWMDERGVSELGEEQWEKELHAMNDEARVVLRVNALRTTKEELKKILAKEHVETELLSHYPDALVLKKRQHVSMLQSFKDGLFELQDASSQRVAQLLDAKAGMHVVDACAGSGGKTLHLAALMKNTGKIIALDTEERKLEELRRRAIRAGATIIEPRLIDSPQTIRKLENSADCLLLDVPCSGIGTLRRNPDAKWKLNLHFIEKIKTLQEEILSTYPSMLKKGGRMVYSTCSIFPSENEKQITVFLNTKSHTFELIEQKSIYPSEGFDGFYLALLQKK